MNVKIGIFYGVIAALGAMAPLGVEARDLTDMAGRTVSLPDTIESVITVGSVPVINTLVFAAGRGDALVMGLPENFNPTLSANQFLFAPQMRDKPVLQDANLAPDVEKIVATDPDVALTFEQSVVDLLSANDIPTLMLRIGNPDEIKSAVGLVGQLFGDDALGGRYATYFDGVAKKVSERLADVPEADRPTVLYLNPVTMTQPHLVAEWWIPAGGGTSVTNDGRTQNALTLTREVVVAANPDFILVMQPDHIDALKADPVLSTLKAVSSGNVHVSPRGGHVWGNRAAELALTPMWLASLLHPEQVPHADLVAEAKTFYSEFFKVELSDEQIEGILRGRGAQ